MNSHDDKIIKRWITAAPVIFLLHFLEEVPGFVEWANAYVDQDISGGFFLGVNFFILGVTSAVALIMWAITAALLYIPYYLLLMI